MATIRVYVYKDPGFIDSYKVHPPIVVLSGNDKLELVNTVDDHDAFWTVPKDPFQGDDKQRKGLAKVQIQPEDAQERAHRRRIRGQGGR